MQRKLWNLFQAVIALFLGGLAIYNEFKPVKEVFIFFNDTEDLPFFLLCLSAIVFFIINLKQYIKHKKVWLFTPLCISILSFFIIEWHIGKIYQLDNSTTSFTAFSPTIGDDGGLVLEFKENGYLIAQRSDVSQVTNYRGSYSQKKDTITLNIPFDFTLGRTAVLKDTVLQFINDTIRFQVYKKQ